MSNVQHTSIDAYYSLNLSKRQSMIYYWINHLGNATNLEISHRSKIPINQVTPRTNELVKIGLVEPFEYRKCGVSGRRVIAWRIRKMFSDGVRIR